MAITPPHSLLSSPFLHGCNIPPMERQMTVEAEAGLWGFQEPHRGYTVLPSQTTQSTVCTEMRLGGPHGMPLMSSFGPNGSCWVILNIGRSKSSKSILGSVLAKSQMRTQISENLECIEMVCSSLSDRTFCGDGNAVDVFSPNQLPLAPCGFESLKCE